MENKKNKSGYATGKIILIGEHSVVCGEPAIAIPFPEARVNVEINKSNGELKIISDYPEEELENIKTAINFSLNSIKTEDKNLEIIISSSIPPERGMGSSAAVAVAVIRALFNYFDKELDDELLFNITQESEKITHGKPSGLDATTTASNMPVYFIKGEKPNFFSIDMKNTWLIVADTGIKGQTRTSVANVAQKLALDEKSVMNSIKTLGKLTINAKDALFNDDNILLGEIFTNAQKELKSLGVSNDTLDKLTNAAMEEGALGAKLTGGGNGGCMISLSNSLSVAEKISKRLLEEGAHKTWIYRMNKENV